MDTEPFLYAAVFLLAVTITTVLLFKRAGLGSLLGLLVAGVIVGPHSPGPSITENVEAVRHFTELGIVLLLFIIGLEMQPRKLWELRRAVFGLGTLQVLVTGLVLALYAGLFASSWNAALLIGMTLALSSTAFVVQLLQERNEFNSRYGKTAFGVLLLQDLAIVPLLAVVPMLAGQAQSPHPPFWEKGGLALLILGAIIVAGRWLVPFLLGISARQRNADAFWMTVLLAVFGAAAASHVSGLSMGLGAFVMGMILSTSPYHYQMEALVEPYKGLLLGLFFVAVGMSIEPNTIAADLPLFLIHVAAVLLIKMLVIFLLAFLIFNFHRATSLRLAFLLAQSGEFGFVLFSAAKAQGAISDYTFSLMVAVISVSMLLTPPLVKIGDYLARRTAPRNTSADTLPEAAGKVLVLGYGRVGRIICAMLEARGIAYLALEHDLERVALGKQEKRPVFYGDALNPSLLEAAGMAQARMAVVAVHDVNSEGRIASHLRNLNLHLPIVARAWDLNSRDRLLAMGVDEALPVAIEGSLQVGAAVLRRLGAEESELQNLMEELRSDYSHIRRPEK